MCKKKSQKVLTAGGTLEFISTSRGPFFPCVSFPHGRPRIPSLVLSMLHVQYCTLPQLALPSLPSPHSQQVVSPQLQLQPSFQYPPTESFHTKQNTKRSKNGAHKLAEDTFRAEQTRTNAMRPDVANFRILADDASRTKPEPEIPTSPAMGLPL